MELVQISKDIQTALSRGKAVVALESALITHGFAYPDNIDITKRMAAAIEAEGAVPAVIGIWKGQAVVGLEDAQIAALGADRTAVKVSVRDLPLMGVRGLNGGTTVAATMLIAHKAGLRVFATGGIGGVHRGHPEDISADLPMLATTPLMVVCAGAKSILDLPRTLEYLETWGVPVVGWETDQFPAFYSRSSGLPVDYRLDQASQVAEVYQLQRQWGLRQGMLVAAPVPVLDELPASEVEPLIAQAVAEADAQGVSGKAMTPFLLSRLVTLSESRTRRANESLLINNARIAARIARASV